MRRIKAALLAALCLFGTLPATALAWDSEPRLVLQEEGSRWRAWRTKSTASSWR